MTTEDLENWTLGVNLADGLGRTHRLDVYSMHVSNGNCETVVIISKWQVRTSPNFVLWQLLVESNQCGSGVTRIDYLTFTGYRYRLDCCCRVDVLSFFYNYIWYPFLNCIKYFTLSSRMARSRTFGQREGSDEVSVYVVQY